MRFFLYLSLLTKFLKMVKRTQTEFIVLKAYNGDCILIKTFDSNNDEYIILVDGGTASTFEYSLKNELKTLTRIDLLILTHIDSDHIGGLIKLFNNSLVDKLDISEIWVNHPELIDVRSGGLIGFDDANKFKDLILRKKNNVVIKEISTSERDIKRDNILFTILSPTQEILNLLYEVWEYNIPKPITKTNISSKAILNTTNIITLEEMAKISFSPKSIKEDIVNASSIAFILSCPDITLLLLGDSRAEIIEQELISLGYNSENSLACDYVKISHHGSKNNTSKSLLELLKTSNYIISTNGGSKTNKHPSREVIGRIVFNEQRNDKLSIFMNYPIRDIKDRAGNFITEKDMEGANWVIEHKNKF